MFRERFDQEEAIFAHALLDARHHFGVIDRVADAVRSLLTWGKPDLQIELHRLRHPPLPLVDADQHLDAKVADENDVHGHDKEVKVGSELALRLLRPPGADSIRVSVRIRRSL